MFEASQGPTLAEIQGQQQVTNPANPAMSDVHGWLWLLIANLGFSAIRNLADAMTSQVGILERGIGLVAVVMSVSSVFFLVKKDKRGVSLAKYTFGLYIVIFGFALIATGAQGADIALFIKGFGSSVIWLTYLFVSKRVKAVYYPAVG